jgi:hypothetical protein
MLDNWQRIEEIVKWTGCASVSAFAREIGLLRSENLYQIKRGSNGISRDLSETITERYPEISRAWLLTGEGNMLRNDPVGKNTPIPFFKTDAIKIAQGSLDGDDAPKPDNYIYFATFDGSAFAAITMSDAMAPEIPRGAILFFATADPEAIVPGEMYLIVGPRFSGIRFVRKGTRDDGLRLVPSNRKDYDEITLDRSDIEKLWSVRGIVTGKVI